MDLKNSSKLVMTNRWRKHDRVKKKKGRRIGWKLISTRLANHDTKTFAIAVPLLLYTGPSKNKSVAVPDVGSTIYLLFSSICMRSYSSNCKGQKQPRGIFFWGSYVNLVFSDSLKMNLDYLIVESLDWVSEEQAKSNLS